MDQDVYQEEVKSVAPPNGAMVRRWDEFEQPPLVLLEAKRILVKHWIMFLGCILGGMLLSLAYYELKQPLYEASAMVTVSTDNSTGLNLEQMDLSGSTDVDKKLQTEVKVVSSASSIKATVDRLALQSDRWFNPRGYKAARDSSGQLIAVDKLPPISRDQVVRVFAQHLSVEPIPRTTAISIKFRSPSPELSANIVNTLVSTYIERGYQVKYQETLSASDWLSHQLTELKTNTEQAQKRLADYQQQHGMIMLGADDSTNSVTVRLEELSKELTAAETDRITKEARYRLSSTQDPELVAQVAPNSTLSLLRGQQAELKAEYADATSKYGTAYPKVVELKGEIAKVDADIHREVNKIVEALRIDYVAAQQTETKLSAALDQQRAEAFKLNQAGVEFAILEREAESSQDLYQGLQKKLKEASVLAGLRSNNMEVVDSATAPSKPVVPDLPMNLAVGLLIGIFAGASLAILTETLNDSFEDPEEIEQATGLPMISIIPPIKDLRKQSASDGVLANLESAIEVSRRPRSAASEAFRALRTSILLSSSAHPPKVLLVTSTHPSEGKSTIAQNLAVVLAQQQSKVLLIDADLRRPTVQRNFHLQQHLGLSDVLAGLTTLEDSITVSSDVPNLHIMSAGNIPPDPADLLGSPATADMLHSLRGKYGHIVLDAPPVISVTDPVILSALADRVVFVVRAGVTGKRAVQRAVKVLLRANGRFAGIVMNAAKRTGGDYYYYYGTKSSDNYYSKE